MLCLIEMIISHFCREVSGRKIDSTDYTSCSYFQPAEETPLKWCFSSSIDFSSPKNNKLQQSFQQSIKNTAVIGFCVGGKNAAQIHLGSNFAKHFSPSRQGLNYRTLLRFRLLSSSTFANPTPSGSRKRTAITKKQSCFANC